MCCWVKSYFRSQFMKHLVIEMYIEKNITPIFTHQAFYFILKIRLGYSPELSF